MNGKAALKRLEKLARVAQQRAQDEAGRVRQIAVYCDGELMEVMPVGAKVIAVVNVDTDKL